MKRRQATTAILKRRRQWLVEHPFCMGSGCKNIAHSIHEIARGSHRAQAIKKPESWLALCWDCHQQMDDYSVWPIARQLALKKVADLEGYDREKVNELRSRTKDAITEDEVDQYLSTIQ